MNWHLQRDDNRAEGGSATVLHLPSQASSTELSRDVVALGWLTWLTGRRRQSSHLVVLLLGALAAFPRLRDIQSRRLFPLPFYWAGGLLSLRVMYAAREVGTLRVRYSSCDCPAAPAETCQEGVVGLPVNPSPLMGRQTNGQRRTDRRKEGRKDKL